MTTIRILQGSKFQNESPGTAVVFKRPSISFLLGYIAVEEFNLLDTILDTSLIGSLLVSEETETYAEVNLLGESKSLHFAILLDVRPIQITD